MTTEKFVREPERRDVTGVPTSTWYEMMAKGQAPKPVNLTPHTVAWLRSEIADWQHQRIAERDGDDQKVLPIGYFAPSIPATMLEESRHAQRKFPLEMMILLRTTAPGKRKKGVYPLATSSKTSMI